MNVNMQTLERLRHKDLLDIKILRGNLLIWYNQLNYLSNTRIFFDDKFALKCLINQSLSPAN